MRIASYCLSSHRVGSRLAAIILVLLLAWLAFPAAGQNSAALPEKTRARIEAIVAEEMPNLGIPGMSIAVATGGELRWSNGYGMSDLENLIPVKAITMFRLGSISKPITAVAAMQLAEAGRLDLDAPVQKYVPGFPKKPWPVTSRLLLAHLGGMRHYGNQEEMDSTRHYTNRSEPLRIFQDDPLVAEPGTRYNYTTYGFNLVGAVAEAAAGESFLAYLRSAIFEPAGMTTIQDDNTYRIIPNRTRGYRRAESGQIENCSLADTSNKVPGGGMISTSADLVRFALAVRGGRLLKPETIRAMWTEQKLKNGEPTGYGLGWRVRTVSGRRWVGHGGGQQGVSTMLAMLPDDGLVVAVMANLEASNTGRVADRILEVLATEAARK